MTEVGPGGDAGGSLVAGVGTKGGKGAKAKGRFCTPPKPPSVYHPGSNLNNMNNNNNNHNNNNPPPPSLNLQQQMQLPYQPLPLPHIPSTQQPSPFASNGNSALSTSFQQQSPFAANGNSAL